MGAFWCQKSCNTCGSSGGGNPPPSGSDDMLAIVNAERSKTIRQYYMAFSLPD